MKVAKNTNIIVRTVGLILILLSIFFLKGNHSPFILTIGIFGLIILIISNFVLKEK
ncbi:hypothetical protein [Neobacillus sp. PS2-9]|uniref:hypothetical protein n=1 Tax=Neobacillus sp. PS2-9 TaxID=3070676 RepID=UPI0027DEDF47|nr:hypothetical protein [Neobacillus sp. PS2-9]WML57897.1 hypothetical protein RCG25_23950 [Neobacillus sp. PS2-9]